MILLDTHKGKEVKSLKEGRSNELLLDLVISEAQNQGHRVYMSGERVVFNIHDDLVICPRVPSNEEDWRLLLGALTRAGMLWPRRRRG